jgi:hypothetical protein
VNLTRHFEAAAEEARILAGAEYHTSKFATIHHRAQVLFELYAENESSRPDATDGWSRSDPTYIDPTTSAVIDLASAYLDEEDQP